MEDLNLKKFGPACGKHGSCVFYKGFKYIKDGKSKIISLGHFFFMKIFDSIPVSIGELQLVWEDKNSGNDLVSVRIYFLPECTPDGRQPKHGEDEVLAYYEKIVLKLSDLASMLVHNVSWSDGRRAFTVGSKTDVESEDAELKGLSDAFKMNSFGLDNRDIEKEKETLDPKDMIEDNSPDIVILTYPKYCRYRCMMKRLENCEDKWLRHAVVCALGGFNAKIDNNRVYFCRDIFEHGDLDDFELRCDHLAPNLKGRPRKRKGSRREGVDSSDESSCSSSFSSQPDTASNKVRTGSRATPLRNGFRIDKTKVSKDEQEFLIDLHKYMKSRNTPIGRIPSLGFKQIDLFQFYQYAEDLGGYEQISNKRMWKHLYDKLGGNPGFTSAATCTRRHYEKLLLPYERYKMGQDTGPLPHKKKKISRVDDDYSLLEKVKMSRQLSNSEKKSGEHFKSDDRGDNKQVINGKSDLLHHKEKIDMKDRAMIIKQEIEKMKMRKDAANKGRLILNKTKTKTKVYGTHEKKKSFEDGRKLRWAEKGRRPSGGQKTVRELLHRNGQEPNEMHDGMEKSVDQKHIGASVKEEMRNLEKREEKVFNEVKVPSLSQALPASASQVDPKSLNSQTLLPTLSQGHPMFYPQLIPVGGAIRGLPPVGMPFMIPHNFGFQAMPGPMPQIPGVSTATVVKDEKPLHALNKLVSDQSVGATANKSAIIPQSNKLVSSNNPAPPSAHCSQTSSKGSIPSQAGCQGQRPITPAHSHSSKRQYPYPDRNHSSYSSRDSSLEPVNDLDLKRQKTQTPQEKKHESASEYEMPVLDLSMKTLRAQEARHQRGESLLFNTSFNKENRGLAKQEADETPQDLSLKSKTVPENKDQVPAFHKSVPLNIPFPHLTSTHNSGVKEEPAVKKEFEIQSSDSFKSILPSSGAITAISGLPIDIGSFVHPAFPQQMLMQGIFPTPLQLQQMIQGQVAAGLPMVRPELLPSPLMFPPNMSAVAPTVFSSVLPSAAKTSTNNASAIKR